MVELDGMRLYNTVAWYDFLLYYICVIYECPTEGNSFTGTVPKEIGDLANLRTLSVGSNKLSGSLPAELGILDGLENLDIGKGAITYGTEYILVFYFILNHILIHFLQILC